MEAEVILSDGGRGFAAALRGVSTGSREAIELRDGDARRYLGKRVLKAVGHVNTELAKALVHRTGREQSVLDQEMKDLDGTPTKS